MKAAIPVALGVLLAGCSGSEQDREYASWANKPTPESWRLGQSWSFVLLDKRGARLGSMTVRFTDQKAASCLDGNWKRVEAYQDATRSPGLLGRPISYTLEGSALTVGVCDGHQELVGELRDNRVFGQYIALSSGVREPLGSFYASATHHICWVDLVVISGDGIRVEFTGGFLGGSTEPRGQFVLKNGLITWASGQSERGLLLTRGQSGFLTGGVENYCTIAFAEVDSHMGINAHAFFASEGVPTKSQTSDEFIPGEQPQPEDSSNRPREP